MLIASAIRKGRKVKPGDRKFMRQLYDSWPGMFPENWFGPVKKGD